MERGASEGTCRAPVLVLALEEALGPCLLHPRTGVPRAVALGRDPKVKEAQERNRVPHQSRAGDTDGKTGLWRQI